MTFDTLQRHLASNFYNKVETPDKIQLSRFRFRRPIREIQRGCEAESLGWLRGPAVEHRSLAGVLSLSCVRLVADG